MNSKKFLLLIITLLFFIYKSFGDESSDINKKKNNYIISHYSIDEYNTFFDNKELYSFKKITELDLTCKFYFLPFYSFLFYFNDIFEFDFYEIYRLYNYKEINGDYLDNDSLNNTFTIELSNEFSIKKILSIDLNIDFINEISSNKKKFTHNRLLSLSVVPWIKLSGDYYFGYFWELRVYQSFEFFPQEDYNSLIPSSYIKAGYQFFRFYGPKNFKFSILFDDEFYYYIPLKLIPGSIYNIFRFGFKFNFFNFEPFAYFKHDIYYYSYGVEEEVIIYDKTFNNFNQLGIDLGLKYKIENFTLAAEYIGTYDIISNDGWFNEIDFYFKFNIKESRESNKKN